MAIMLNPYHPPPPPPPPPPPEPPPPPPPLLDPGAVDDDAIAPDIEFPNDDVKSPSPRKSPLYHDGV